MSISLKQGAIAVPSIVKLSLCLGLEKATVYKHQAFCHTLLSYRCTTCTYNTEEKDQLITHSRYISIFSEASPWLLV
jgi:hypothetical protein